MKELCILFLHHDDDDLTRIHAEMIRRMNPESTLVALTFNKGLPDAVRPMPYDPKRNEWRDSDYLIYSWFFSKYFILAKRYLIMEYDTLCTMPCRDFYDSVWDAPAAGAAILTVEKNSDWYWFREVSNPKMFQGNLAGISPLSGILLSYETLRAISELSLAVLYSRLYVEVRIGTLIRAAGQIPQKIRDDAVQYISHRTVIPRESGIWHPVKALSSSIYKLQNIPPAVKNSILNTHLANVEGACRDKTKIKEEVDAYNFGRLSLCKDAELCQFLNIPLEFGRFFGSDLTVLILKENGKIEGIHHDNEFSWSISTSILYLHAKDGRVTTVFNLVLKHNRLSWLLGKFEDEKCFHYLTEARHRGPPWAVE